MNFKMTALLVSTLFVFAACSHGGHHKGHHSKKGHHHKMWKMMDADNDGNVTREEFDKAHGEMFKKMDANGDGKITKEEKMAHKKAKMGDKKPCCGNS